MAGLLCSSLVVGWGCGQPDGASVLPRLTLESVTPHAVLPGTELVIRGSGFMAAEVATLRVAFVGQVGEQPFEWVVSPTRISNQELIVTIEAELAAGLIPQSASSFVGHIAVTRESAFEDGLATVALAVSFSVTRSLKPSLSSVSPLVFRPGELIDVWGADFLFPGEGVTSVTFDGVLRTDSPALELPVDGVEVALSPEFSWERGHLSLPVGAAVFGIRPATFDGTIRVTNYLPHGETLTSEPLAPGSLRLEGPSLESFSPLEASRGQLIEVRGSGLLPANPVDGSGTIFLLEGVLDADRGPTLTFTEDQPLGVFPDYQPSSSVAEVVLRVRTNEDGKAVGLGAISGMFEGQVSPMLFHGAERHVGAPAPLSFRVLPATQHVHLQFLPAFDDALLDFGLIHARADVIARILEVVARDYEGVNVVFSSEAPADFEEYMIVEVGGEDPNGTGLFGLDNTAGKDVGNRRFDDVIGGFNADTRARGFAAYGGIFASEFLNLSPSLGTSDLADPRFDEIFGPFCPDLGGQPAASGEVSGEGPRAVALAQAVRVLGNLLGSTISHETGHALGLSAESGAFHNIGDNPGWIMDAGQFRPFGERAELPGEGPAVFSPANRQYLEEVLPL